MNNTTSKEIIEIPLEYIVPNRFQPRLTFDVEALNELANSIREHGIIQPLVVRKLGDKYEIIAGERRYKAASLIGMTKVPCIIMDLNDNESAEVAVIENIQRKEMTPLEEARSFKKLLDRGYLTQDDLARRMGKSQPAIANKLRLLNLDEVVQDAILNGKISERHARSLLKIQDKQEQRKILSEIIEKRLTVRQTDDLIKERYGIDTGELDMNKREPLLSTPEVKIPTNNIINDVNPQLNILNNIGRVDQNKVYEPDKIDVLEPIPDENTNPALDIFRSNPNNRADNIQNVINPSVFGNTNFQSPSQIQPDTQESTQKQESVMVDINQIKSTAQDIREEQKPLADIDNLMKSETPKPDNKFFVDLNLNTDDFIDVEDKGSPKVRTVVDRINKSIEELKLQGNNIYKEEQDLGNAYQIIIRIDK